MDSCTALRTVLQASNFLLPLFFVRKEVIYTVACITTTAIYEQTIEVGLSYEPYRDVTCELMYVRLFHWNGTEWEDITTRVDTDISMVYGEVTSFSWFYIGGEWVYIGASVPSFPNLYIGIAAAFGAAILGYFIRRRVTAKV